MRRLVPAASPHAVAPIKHRSLRTFRREKMPLLIEKSTSSRLLRAAMRPTLCALLVFSIFGKATPAQEPAAQHAQAVTPLANLLEEAEKNNPCRAASISGLFFSAPAAQHAQAVTPLANLLEEAE